MASGSTGYEPSSRLLHFDGDERNYEQWECRILAFMKIKDLKTAILPGTPATAENKERAYAQLVQFLDSKSLNLVMHDAKDDGRKALEILRRHYAGTGKQRIISMYTTLCSLTKLPNEDLTDYIIKCEQTATQLRSAGKVIEDSLLIAMVIKGLPPSYKPFIVYIQQQDDEMSFTNFKVAIRNYEENEKASVTNMSKNLETVMHISNNNFQNGRYRDPKQGPPSSRQNGGPHSKPICNNCGGAGHKSHECPTPKPPSLPNINNNKNVGGKGKFCSYCKKKGHTIQTCRNKNKDRAKHVREYDDEDNYSHGGNNTHSFCFAAVESSTDEILDDSVRVDELSVLFDNDDEISQYFCFEDEDSHPIFEQCVDDDIVNNSLQSPFPGDVTPPEENELRASLDDSVTSLEHEHSEIENSSQHSTFDEHIPTQNVVQSPCDDNSLLPSTQVSLDSSNSQENKDSVRETSQVSEYEHSKAVDEISEPQHHDDAMLVDSGSTAHIERELSKFVDFDPNFKPEKHKIELADGSVITSVVEKKGTVLTHFKNEQGEICEIYLDNCSYIPTFPQSIFSVKAATKDSHGHDTGAYVLLKGNYGELVSKDGTKFPIHCRGELYFLETFPGDVSVSTKKKNEHSSTPNSSSVDDSHNQTGMEEFVNFCSSNTTRSSTLEDWHRILGHVNQHDILKLEKLVSDMKITSKQKFDCETCTLGKQVVTHNRNADERSTTPLEFVHSDLAGPIEPMAKDKFRYVMNFVDDFSGVCFVYFLREKSDAVLALQKFLSDVAPYGKVKNLTFYDDSTDSNVVKRLRTDNGGEFVSKEFEAILVKNQIRHEFCAPYSPHQNGTAERNWRTLFGIARSMLIESKLPKYLWTYAVMTAAHIRNRMYNQRTQDTPFHMLTGKQPSISKLHLFGSVCYANIHGKKKLDPRCEKGYFIGYDKYSPSFLVYFPETNTVKKNANVKFTDRYDHELSVPQKPLNLPDLSIPFENTPFDQMQSLFGHSQERNNNTPAPAIDKVPLPPAFDGHHVPNNNAADEHFPQPAVNNGAENTSHGDRRKYPQRNRVRPNYLHDHANSSVQTIDKFCKVACVPVPSTHNQATHSSESDKWQLAMESEMNSLRENNVFTAVPLPPGKKAVGSRWVFARKSGPNKEIIHKARFVAKGFAQVEGVDYTDTFSPTAKMTTIRMLIQFAAERSMKVHQLDVKTAYLNAPLDCEVYLEPPKGFTESGDGGTVLVWKLHKSLYGLKQSGRNWNFVLSDFFRSIGFTQSEVDACLFTKFDGNHSLFVVIWVDDIVLASDSDKALKVTKNLLKQRFKMSDLGEISWFLGIEFHVSRSGITMSQSRYIEGVLERFGYSSCNPRATPCEVNLQKYDQPANNTAADVKTYRQIVGSLIYAMTCTRPDLAFVVTRLSQSLENPSESDWMTVKHVMKYLKGTINQKLLYCKSQNGLAISGFSDSDWASAKDRKSTTGYCFYLNFNSAPIAWKSKKQPTIALSTCEAEYMALTAATQEAMFLAMLSKEFGLDSSDPIHIRGDNASSINLVKNPVITQYSKHIDIKFHFIREKFNNRFIELSHVPSAENVADLMTKPAVKVKLDEFKSFLFGQRS